MNTKILASNIYELRTEKQWTQNDLADFLNVSRQAVSKWETGLSLPDLETLLRLSKLFSKSINELIENNVFDRIKTLEEILQVDKPALANVLNALQREDLAKAAKGLSPTALDYICSIDGFSNLELEAKALGPVKLTEVEAIHREIVTLINEHLMGNEGL